MNCRRFIPALLLASLCLVLLTGGNLVALVGIDAKSLGKCNVGLVKGLHGVQMQVERGVQPSSAKLLQEVLRFWEQLRRPCVATLAGERGSASMRTARLCQSRHTQSICDSL